MAGYAGSSEAVESGTQDSAEAVADCVRVVYKAVFVSDIAEVVAGCMKVLDKAVFVWVVAEAVADSMKVVDKAVVVWDIVGGIGVEEVVVVVAAAPSALAAEAHSSHKVAPEG